MQVFGEENTAREYFSETTGKTEKEKKNKKKDRYLSDNSLILLSLLFRKFCLQ